MTQNITQISSQAIKRGVLLLVAFTLAFCSLLIARTAPVNAAQITGRALEISDSDGGATSVTYTFTFTVPSSTVLQSFQAQICTTASGSCTTPTGFDASSADLASQPTNYGDASGWSDASTTGALRMTKTGNSAAPSSSQTVAFNGITNPSSDNETFFARITTYSDDAYTTGVDSGVAASSTASAIDLTALVAETLTFCSGTSITGTNCGTISGSSVDLGTLTASTTGSGTSVMAASTNGQGGYSITVNGATLTSGANTITALATQTASSVGSEQFGINLKDNATPNVGTDESGSGSGTSTANYGTADSFRFVTGDSVASASGASDGNTFTVSYIANIGGATEAGTYTATMTYICTATF